MNPIPVAVIGDLFMRADEFERALLRHAAGKAELAVRKLELPWPDIPMVMHDDKVPGVSEFVGDPDKIAAFIGDARVLVNHSAPVTAAMLDRLRSLRLIAVARGGPVNVDVKAAQERGIEVITTPGRNATAVAEYTVGAILAETRKIRVGHEALRAGRWRGDLYRADRAGEELADLAVGSIGCGRVGRQLLRLLEPFGCRLLVADPYASCEPPAEMVELERLLAEADVVVLNARVSPETVGIINRSTLRMMKPTALLVNPARGPLVDYSALHDALVDGTIAGAVLDTFSPEPPPPDWPLLQLDNVTLTPHIAGASRRTCRQAAETIAAKTLARLADIA